MPAPSRYFLPVWLAVAVTFLSIQPLRAENSTSPNAGDTRAARVADRYRAMLQSNPVEGIALDRLWKYHEEHDSTAALLKSYEDAADTESADLATLLVDGHLLKKVGRLDGAAARYERAAKRDPASPLPALALGDLAVARGLPEEAARQYADALNKLPPGDRRRADLLFKEGSHLLAAGKTEEAAACWEQVAALDPNDFAVRRQLADAYEKNGLPERAITQYDYIRAHADPAQRASALRELGRLQEAQGHFDDARAALEDGLALTARDNWLHGDLLNRLIRLYQRADRVAELARHWQETAAQAPRDLGGYLRLEALAEAEGDIAAERAALEKIVALNPRDRDSTLKLAALLAQTGERQRAGQLYDGLLTPQPGNLGLILARAELDVQLGQPAEAVRRIESRVAQSPADESVATPALAFFLGHRLDEAAERLLRAAVDRQPTALEPALALAKFLFTQRRTADARTVLAAAALQPGDEKPRAARLAQIAEAYTQAGASGDALSTWQSVAALLPMDPAPLLAEADLLRARGDGAGAREKLEAAAGFSAPGDARLTVERKLFDLLRGDRGTDEEAAISVAPGARPAGGEPAPNPALRAYITGLADAANQDKNVENYLRLARWLAWARNPQAARAAVDQALTLEPENLTALTLSADMATALGQQEVAAQTLREIVRLDPPHSLAAQRQLAEIQLQHGETEQALKSFETLQARAPGSRTALTDLALAQQRTDRWFDAVATWERAYALPGSTPAQKTEIRQPLLAAYEHVGQFSRAFDVLLRAVDDAGGVPAKQDLFRQLVDLSHEQGLEPRLNEEFERRLRLRPDEYFALTALATLREDAGDPAGAYALLQRAHFSSPDPVESLRALVQSANALGATGDAVNAQKRLCALPGQATPTNLGTLADLQESDQNPEDAARTWNEVAARFPRDPDALTKAAGFFERGRLFARARALVRAAVDLSPAEPQGLLRLAALDARAGDVSTALADYESILAHTEAEAPGQPLTLPDELRLPFDPLAGLVPGAGKFRLRVFPPRTPPVSTPPTAGASADETIRLRAITEVSRLLAPPTAGGADPLAPQRARWIARWQQAADAGAATEPLDAFYFAGDRDTTMRLLTQLRAASRNEDAGLPGAYVLAGLRLGAYPLVGQWVWSGNEEETPLRVQTLAAGLDRYLGTGGKPTATLLAGVFPVGVDRQDLLWEAAKEFAGLHWYAAAAELGERVLTLKASGRGAYATEVAEWLLYTGAVDRARAALRLAVDEGGGWTFDANVSAALSSVRQYYLLLPAGERPAFVNDYLPRVRAGGGKLPAALAGVLLHGLAGDEAAARRDIDHLLATRMLDEDFTSPSADARRWSYLLANGVQLQSWHLDALAAYLWRQSLREANPFDHKVGEAEGALAEIRRRLVGAEVALADSPETARESVAAYLDTNPPTGTAASVAGELMNDQRFAAAIQIFEDLCRVEPGDTEHWRSLFSAYETAGLPDRLERTLASLFEGGRPLPEGLSRTDFVGRWAAARERCGDIDGAGEVLTRERALTPAALPILLQLAQTDERAGRYAQAATVWRDLQPLDPNDATLLNLARGEEAMGHRDAAIRLLQSGLNRGVETGRNEVATQLVRLYLAGGELRAARDLADALLKEGRVDPLPTMAANLVAAGQGDEARRLLSAGVLRSRDANTRFRLQQALIGLSPAPGEDPRPLLRQLARLESFAKDSPSLRNGFEAAKYKLVRAVGAEAVLERDLRARWQEGKGDYLAGERLATLYLDTKQTDRLREVIGQFDHRPMLPDQLLAGIERALVQGGYASLALPISDRLYQRFPQNADYGLQRATVLWKSGQQDEANRVLDGLAAVAVIHDDLIEKIALLYLSLGGKDRAQRYFEQVVCTDPQAVDSPGSFVELARLYLEKGRNAEAEVLLQTAYRQEAVRDFAPLVNFLVSTGRLEGRAALQMPAPDFLLSFPRRARLLAAVSDRLNKDGRAEEGRELLFRHAAFLAELPETAAELAQNIPATEKGRLADSLRIAIGHIQPPYPRLLRLLQNLAANPEGGAQVAGTNAPNPVAEPDKAAMHSESK